MGKQFTQIRKKEFYKQLFKKTALPISTILAVGILYIVLMSIIDHRFFPFPYIILVLALIKTMVISATTLKQLSKVILNCHSVERLLLTFGLLIGISILSFATDYTCLYQFENTAFEGMTNSSQPYIYDLFHFFYFSLITFSTLGYGDIVPVSGVARFVVMLEIVLSFLIVVFALTNIKKIHLNE